MSTRRLNAHLVSIASSGSFRMPGEVLPRCGDASGAARLSSFGFSGTIAHALLVSAGGQSWTQFASSGSLYRREKAPWLVESSGHLVTPSLHAEANDMNPVLSIGTLAVLSHHVVGGSILLPGVGYVEVAFAAGASRRAVLSAVAFVRPCVLPAPGWGAVSERCTLRCMRREADTFEIASLSSTGPLPHWFGCLADSCKDSSSETCLSRRTYLARPGEHTEASVQCTVDRAALLPRASPSAAKISIEQTLVGSSGHWLRRRVAPLPDTETIDLF